MPKKKRSLGRDPFEDAKEQRESSSVEKLIKGKTPATPGAREVIAKIKLTPSNLKHLDGLRAQLAAQGKRDVSRDELIRIAITLLSIEDIQ